MISRWYKLKDQAILMRKNGTSIIEIERHLKIPKSTLSGWLKPLKLSARAKKIIYKNWKQRLVKTRRLAIAWHNLQKLNRLKHAESEALNVVRKIDIKNPVLLDLALAVLYLGEGFKIENTGMGNSDPMILKFFIAVLRKNYNIPTEKFRCELHLRADQDPDKTKWWWSKELKIPLGNFTATSIDKRTVGSVTYPTYKGVCIVRCGSVAIQRKLLYISKMFCQKVIEEMRA